MAPKKKADVQAEASAAAVNESNEAQKVAEQTLNEANATEKPKPEDMIFAHNGQPVLDNADNPYTIQRLTELEQQASGNFAEFDQGMNERMSKFEGEIKRLSEANEGLEQQLDMWKTRATDAERKIANAGKNMALDSMGKPVYTDNNTEVRTVADEAAKQSGDKRT